MAQVIVLSGPIDRAPLARSTLQQKGLKVETSLDNVRSNRGPIALRDYNHGFEHDDSVTFITAVGDVDDWQAVEHLGFELRLHWEQGTEGEWVNPQSRPDPSTRLDAVIAHLRAQGITLPEGL